eukprot:3339205-Prymnesium_polylepis.1
MWACWVRAGRAARFRGRVLHSPPHESARGKGRDGSQHSGISILWGAHVQIRKRRDMTVTPAMGMAVYRPTIYPPSGIAVLSTTVSEYSMG